MRDYRNNLKFYVRIRNQMQTGDIIAFKGTAFGAKAIIIGTKSNYCHVGLVVRLGSIVTNRIFIIEAVPFGVILQTLSRKLV